jgi:hypothetical protein
MKILFYLHFTSAFLMVIFPASAQCSAHVSDFEEWAPLETNADRVRIAACDTSMLVDGGSSRHAIERYVNAEIARRSSATTDGSPWQPKTNMYGAALSMLLPDEEQYYVQFAIHVNDLTAAVFESFTGRRLLSMVADRAFVAVGSRDWRRRAQAFPGVVFVSARSHASKVCAFSGLELA